MKPEASHGAYIKYEFSCFSAVSVTALLTLNCIRGHFQAYEERWSYRSIAENYCGEIPIIMAMLTGKGLSTNATKKTPRTTTPSLEMTVLVWKFQPAAASPLNSPREKR